jgi:hypothetical protein
MTNKDIKIINWTLQSIKPLLKQSNIFMWLANDSMKNIQPSIDLLVRATNWINWSIADISWILDKTNLYLKQILNKIKF